MKKKFKPINLSKPVALPEKYLERLYLRMLKTIYKDSMLLTVLEEKEKDE